MEDIKSMNPIKIFIALATLLGLILGIGLFRLYPNQTMLVTIKTIVLYVLLCPIAWYDANYRRIPNKLILVGIFLRFLFYAIHLFTDIDTFFDTVRSDLIACIFVGVALLVLRLLFKNGIGMGDIKLLMLMGFFQGVEAVISSLFFSLIIAWFYAVLLLVTRKKSRKDSIPFAPLILIGTYISMLLTGS